MSIAAFLIAMVGPLAARLLVSCGFALVSIVGLTAAMTAVKSAVTTAIGGLPLAAIQLGGLFGLWEAAGMIFGTCTFLIAWKSTAGFWTLAKA